MKSTVEYSLLDSQELYSALRTHPSGLTHDEAFRRLHENGPNSIVQTQYQWYHILFRQFTSPFIYLLIGSALLSFFLGEVIDSLMILLFVAINAGLGFYQEFHSEKTIKLLRTYTSPQTHLMRDSRETTVESAHLVIGDIVLLSAGDIVPADIRLIDEENLTIDESTLTGESLAVKKISQPLKHQASDLYKATNMCFAGTTVITGIARGVVVATGESTSLGQIAELTSETKRVSTFEKGINQFSSFILKLILTTLVIIFAINIFIKGDFSHFPTLLVFAIALAVSVIPEALPVVITFSLSRGALHLAKNHVIVKRLSAIEDLGSIEVLCTDKTGTLTENILKVADTYNRSDKDILIYGALASARTNNKNHSIHSFDFALLESLSKKQKEAFQQYARIKESPFDPEKKRNSMIVDHHGSHEYIVRGAPEVIVSLCHLAHEDRQNALAWVASEGKKGRRVIAVAYKHLSLHEMESVSDTHLKFMGLIAFVDPIKKSAKSALDEARELGVVLKVLTGDSRDVAGAVAYEIGLIDNPKDVMNGDTFAALDSEEKAAAVERHHVFARVTPAQKHEIITILKKRFEVGFLGEGINDAPALKAANVAIVVSGATDVAREAADIILLKRSLKTIINGIREGRSIFANTNKYIKATLSSNFGNFYTVAIASLFIDFLPLLPVQLLLINLLTDFPVIAVATDNVDPEELKSPRTYNIHEIALVGTILGVVSTIFDFTYFLLFYTIGPTVLQTNWFIGSVITELLFLFSIRTKRSIFRSKPASPVLMILSGIAFMTALVLPYTGIGQKFFSFTAPRTPELIMIIGIAIAYFIVTEIVKLIYYNSHSQQSDYLRMKNT